MDNINSAKIQKTQRNDNKYTEQEKEWIAYKESMNAETEKLKNELDKMKESENKYIAKEKSMNEEMEQLRKKMDEMKETENEHKENEKEWIQLNESMEQKLDAMKQQIEEQTISHKMEMEELRQTFDDKQEEIVNDENAHLLTNHDGRYTMNKINEDPGCVLFGWHMW